MPDAKFLVADLGIATTVLSPCLNLFRCWQPGPAMAKCGQTGKVQSGQPDLRQYRCSWDSSHRAVFLDQVQERLCVSLGGWLSCLSFPAGHILENLRFSIMTIIWPVSVAIIRNSVVIMLCTRRHCSILSGGSSILLGNLPFGILDELRLQRLAIRIIIAFSPRFLKMDVSPHRHSNDPFSRRFRRHPRA
jgi:hypothetical protein